MKKVIFFTSAILISLGLTGCSQKASSSTNSTSSTQSSKKSNVQAKKVTQAPTTNKTSKKSSKTTKKSKTSWSKSKSEQLRKVVKQWSSAADQTYREYTGHGSIKTFGGVTYPEAFSHKKFSIDNHQSIEIGWSPEGKDKYEYNVVAIYNRNVETNGWHTTYLFCLHKGKPVVLVDSTTNVEVIPLTINMDENLNEGFAKIVNEK